MASPGSLLRAFVIVISAAVLSIGALFAVISPVAAADFSCVFSAEPSLALDALGHDLMLNAAPPNGPAAVAFIAGAQQHDLYLGDGFVLLDGIART